MLPDVNVLVYAHRRDAQRHGDYREWVERMVNGSEPYAISDFVINGFVRLVTNRRVFGRGEPGDGEGTVRTPGGGG